MDEKIDQWKQTKGLLPLLQLSFFISVVVLQLFEMILHPFLVILCLSGVILYPFVFVLRPF